MAAEADFFTELAYVLVVAALALLLVRTLRQPLILGYLVAGIAVGPHGPLPFTLVSIGTVEALAELGIMFIMMSLGLEFHPRKLRAIGAVAIGSALIQILVSFGLGQYVASVMGFGRLEAVFIGGALAISSTIVAVKVLEARGELRDTHGRLAVGILLIEDVASVAFLAVVGGLAVTGSLAFGDATSVLLGLAVFTLAALVVGALVAPRFLHYAAQASRELLLIVLLGLVFGVSLLAVHFGFSVALGAFIVGAIIAETRIVETAEHMVEPLRDMFTAVFFVSIGMLIQPGQIVESWKLVAIFSGVVIATRYVLIPMVAFLFGSPILTGLRAGASISQVGEFSFIIIGSGTALGILEPRLLAIFTGVAGVTTLITPYLIRTTGPVHRFGARFTPAPLRTFAHVYSGWVERLGEAEETAVHRRREVALLKRVLLNLTALTVVFGIGLLAERTVRGIFVPVAGYDVPISWGIATGIAIVALPFLLTIWRALRELAVEIVLELVPDRLVDQASTETPLPVMIVRASMGLVAALVLGSLLLAFLPDLGASGRPVLLVGVLVVLAATTLLWRRVASLHGHVETTITGLFGDERKRDDVARDEVLRTIGIHYSISLATRSMVVSPRSRLAHRQIRDAQLRSRTGATIVSLERGGQRLVNPGPSTLILPGDQLLMMGESHHLEKACRIVEVPHAPAVTPGLQRAREPVRVREITLPTDAPTAGKSIAGLNLRSRTGVSLVAAIRGHDHIQNPAPGYALEPGDRLFLFGTVSQLDRAEALLLTGDEDPERPLQRFRDQVGTVAGLDLPEAGPVEGDQDEDLAHRT